MIKFKEILLLKNINGIGKVKINKTYLNILKESNDVDELIQKMVYGYGFSETILKKAKKDAEKIYENILNSDIHVITLFDEEYPDKLRIMGYKKPLILYVKGNIDILAKKNISVIGTRKPSKASKVFEEELVKNIVNLSDRIVLSGLALGCDKIAHLTTVDENKVTMAILPSGVNVITPASNKKLAKEILENGGCLVSEYEPDAKAFKRTYIERDQIVAALSDAIFVVECGIKSGTMHTVNFAKEYNRQIYAYIPSQKPEGLYDGNEFILNKFSNSLKVENIEDFLIELKNSNQKKEPKIKQQTLI